ncbi:rhomboid protease [Mycoplasma sp. CAG:877]|nr:rhomboid protease [Mycoplasma sp. CAG:877]
MESEIMQDNKNVIVMKLLHYFITEKNYNPIILQGVENEIWLENLNEDYKVVRIVSGYIHNDEQFDFDKFKTKRILKKIRKKTLSLKMNVISIFLNLGDNVTENLSENPDALCIKLTEEEDIDKNEILTKAFPDLTKKLSFTEKGMELFMKITNDIEKHNQADAKRVENVFKMKKPIITYSLVIINILMYIIPILFGTYNALLDKYSIYGPAVRAGQYYRLITGTFIHANIFHLFFNCYALAIIGSQLESFLGKPKYLIVYLFSALIGSLFSVTFAGNYYSIGASGAIFGLMGSLVYFGYHYRVYLGNVVKSQIIPLILMNLGIGFLVPGIDNSAHIGGLLGGALITVALGVKNKSSNFEKINGLIVTILFLAFVIYMAFVYSA